MGGLGRDAGRESSLDAIDILFGRFYVGAAPRAIERVGVGAQGGVGLERPVLQVVLRFETGTGEVGDLVAGDSHRVQAVDGGLVEVGHQVVGRRLRRSVARAAA